MSRFISLTRAAIVALTILCLVPTGASAAGDIGVFVEIAGQCVQVQARQGTDISGQLLAPSGNSLGSQHAHVGDLGAVDLCYGQPIGPGERVKLSWSGASSGARTLGIPRLSVHVDRAADVVNGIAPAGATVELHLIAADWRTNAGFTLFRGAVANRQGRYRLDVTNERNIAGGDGVSALIQRGSDTFHVFMTVPFMDLTIGRPDMSAQLEPYQDARFTLMWSSQAVKARAHLLGGVTASGAGSIWRDAGGTFVTPVAGDRVTSDLETDAALRVLQIDLAASAASDVVHGRCRGSSRYALTTSGSGSVSGTFVGTPASDGSFSHDFAGDPDLQVGDRVVVECIRPTGDRVARTVRVS